MKSKNLLKKLGGGGPDLIKQIKDTLEKLNIPYCVTGGFAVNAYAKPVITPECEFVIPLDYIKELMPVLDKKYCVEMRRDSMLLTSPDSELKILIHTEAGLHKLIDSSSERDILGYRMPVAAVADLFGVIAGKAETSQQKPADKEKHFLDLLRLIEAEPELKKQLPESLKDRVKSL